MGGGRIAAAVEVESGEITVEEVRRFVRKVPVECDKIVVARDGPSLEEVRLLRPEDLVELALKSP